MRIRFTKKHGKYPVGFQMIVDPMRAFSLVRMDVAEIMPAQQPHKEEIVVAPALEQPEPLKCKTHRTYTGKRKPRAKCDTCWEIWNASQLGSPA